MGSVPPRAVRSTEKATPKSAAPDLSVAEASVLACLACDDEWAYPFAHISSDTGLSRDETRTACRALAVRGLAQFCRGLMTEDGDVAGSGYSATRAGVLHHWNSVAAPLEAAK